MNPPERGRPVSRELAPADQARKAAEAAFRIEWPNRAVAVAMVEGPSPGLDLVDAVAATGALHNYHLLHAVRGDLLARLGRHQQAADSFTRAAELTSNRAEQLFLRDRASACADAR